MTTTAALVEQSRALDLGPRTFEQAITFADYLANSTLVPRDFQAKPGNCLIAIQWGAELGLGPMQAIQNIAVINGRPALWGDTVIALVRASPLCESIVETDDGATATCTVKRRGEPPASRSFSVDDARQAGLHGKQGPWTQYPKRMRQMRARAFALRDVFPDVLRGLPVAEEAMDSPREVHMGQVDEVRPPARPALPDYSAEAFEANRPKWEALVANGRKTAPELLATLSTKAVFSEQQKAVILSMRKEPPPADAEPAAVDPAPGPTGTADPFLAEYSAAEEGAK